MVRPVRRFVAGTSICFRIEVRNEDDDDRPRITPTPNLPQLQLRASDGTIDLAWTTMTEVETGVFSYIFQSSASDPLGVWQIEFRIVGTTYTVQTIPADVFELVP